MYEAKILVDSISTVGARLTTMQVTFPRMVLAEFNTHRVFSRNSASSRAIPTKKILAQLSLDPYIPGLWPKNKPGMQATEFLDPEANDKATTIVRTLLQQAMIAVQQLEALGVHKQNSNRYLEPWMYHTVIVTATDWNNFFKLRCHKDAQKEIRAIAEMMFALHRESTPTETTDWHMPLVTAEERATVDDTIDWAMVSAGRCARVSYLTHEGIRDPHADMELAVKLSTNFHWSPFEHVAVPSLMFPNKRVGNLRGWTQLRKLFPDESGQ